MKLYYLFSEYNKTEAMSVCDDKDFIDSPRIQTGTYHIGTFLSKAISFLSHYENDLEKISNTPSALIREFKNFSTVDASFPNILCCDREAGKIFDLLLLSRDKLNSTKDIWDVNKSICDYTAYLQACVADPNLCTLDRLNLIAGRCGHYFPGYIPFAGNDDTPDHYEHKWDFPKESSKSNRFQPIQQGRKQKSLIKHKQSGDHGKKIISQIKNYEPLILPLKVYEIQDIVDFILVTLQCLWNKGYVLTQCEYCQQFFFTHNKKQKYCPKQPGLPDEIRNCYLEHNVYMQQVDQENDLYKMHKSISTMLARYYGKDSPECLNFRQESLKRRHAIHCKEDKEEYDAWLKSHYQYKYKDKTSKKKKR